jgi:hypothetical protein
MEQTPPPKSSITSSTSALGVALSIATKAIACALCAESRERVESQSVGHLGRSRSVLTSDLRRNLSLSSLATFTGACLSCFLVRVPCVPRCLSPPPRGARYFFCAYVGVAGAREARDAARAARSEARPCVVSRVARVVCVNGASRITRFKKLARYYLGTQPTPSSGVGCVPAELL